MSDVPHRTISGDDGDRPWPSLVTLGAAGTVTGSRHLIESDGHRVLVDAGLFQGLKEFRLRNWDEFPVSPRDLDAIVITHAHLDHCGYLPRLVRAGFRGDVHVTYDTGKLMSVVLPDSARLLVEEASYANRIGYSKHRPALPLYDEEDAWRALDLLRPTRFDTPVEIAPGVRLEFRPAGHILGSATTALHIDGVGHAGGERVDLVFSGDLGRPQHPVLRPPASPGSADWIIVESTYGDRTHTDEDPVDRLADIVERTIDRGGVVIIPAFAVDRTEVLLYHLRSLADDGRLPDVPVYVDSPMALAALDVYRAAIAEHAADVRPELRGDVDLFDVPGLREVHSPEESKAVTRSQRPGIIIAGSGMASGGRVVHHLKRFLPDPRNSVVLVGFQAAGTRGRSLLDGATALKMHGTYVPVRAEICDLGGFSVHADGDELMAWLASAEREPAGVFVVHGEPDAANELRRRIIVELGWNAVVPHHAERLGLRPSW